MLAALAVFFVPILEYCVGTNGPVVCERYAYIQTDGVPTGYLVLTTLFVFGTLVVLSNHDRNRGRSCLIRWLFLVTSLVLACFCMLTIGVFILPGAPLMLWPVLRCWRKEVP